jgi:hypothetical protein
MDDSRPLVPFVCIATLDASKQLVIEASFCTEKNENEYLGFVKQKLSDVQEVGRSPFFTISVLI